MTEIETIAKGLSGPMRNEWLSLEWTGEYYNPPRYFKRQFAQLGMTDPRFGGAVTDLGQAVRDYLKGEK